MAEQPVAQGRAKYQKHFNTCARRRSWNATVRMANLGRGLVGADNLKQGHDVRRTEEVVADDAVCAVCLLADEGDVDGGGVARQDAVRPAGLL